MNDLFVVNIGQTFKNSSKYLHFLLLLIEPSVDEFS